MALSRLQTQAQQLANQPVSHAAPPPPPLLAVQVPEGQQMKEGSRKHKRLTAIAEANEAAAALQEA